MECAHSVIGWCPHGRGPVLTINSVAVDDPALASFQDDDGQDWADDGDRHLVRIRTICDHLTDLTRPVAVHLACLILGAVEDTIGRGWIRSTEAATVLSELELLDTRLAGLLPHVREHAARPDPHK